MNGVRTTFMRRGYLLTALSALLLLAASTGTASAQSIGFVGSSGTVSETASLEAGALEGPHEITISASDLDRTDTTNFGLGTVTLAQTGLQVHKRVVGANGRLGTAVDTSTSVVAAGDFQYGDVVLLVAQSTNGTKDPNWHDEMIKLTLDAGTGVTVSPAVYTVTVDDQDMAPVAKFTAPSFTLTEGSERMVSLDIQAGVPGGTIPGALDSGEDGTVTISVSNHQMVTIGGTGSSCPAANAGRKAVHIALGDAWGAVDEARMGVFGRTARLSTAAAGNISALAGDTAATMTIRACAVSGFRNQSVTLTILPTNLVEQVPARGNITIGSPLTVTVDSEEAAPTLSFSPTDVTIDEGDSVSTRLIADGMSATEVGMVKLMVEGDAMVSLMHEDTMLEEMDGYVMVDMGRSNSVRLTAMSHESRELQDGDMAYKAWKLVDGSSDAMIGDDSWFRVDVRGSTAVPALPLIGQLLLALFLMAGGSRLYRRRRG